YKRSNDKGVTWQKEVRVSAEPGADSMPLLARSDTALHLVYQKHARTPDAASYYRRSLDGGQTWGDEVLLGKTVFWPAVAVSGANVYVSMNTMYPGDDKNSVVYFRRSLDNGLTWEPQQQISESVRRPHGRSEDPAIVADGKYVHLVWNDNRDVEP